MADDDGLEVTSLHEASQTPAAADGVAMPLPSSIGRYRVERLLGQGGFGLVYLAYDDQLDRHVAIKVPHANLFARPEQARLDRAEARTVANLDHPAIVPVHDVGSTVEAPIFVVSKYVEGSDLATLLHTARLTHVQAAEAHGGGGRRLAPPATPKAWSTATSSRATFCSTSTRGRSSSILVSRCTRKTSAAAPATWERRPT